MTTTAKKITDSDMTMLQKAMRKAAEDFMQATGSPGAIFILFGEEGSTAITLIDDEIKPVVPPMLRQMAEAIESHIPDTQTIQESDVEFEAPQETLEDMLILQRKLAAIAGKDEFFMEMTLSTLATAVRAISDAEKSRGNDDVHQLFIASLANAMAADFSGGKPH